MRTHNQTAFVVELLQPDWLPKRSEAFYRWSVGLLVGLHKPESKIELAVDYTWSWRNVRSTAYIPLIFGLIVGLCNGFFAKLLVGLVAGLLVGLAVWLVTGLFFALLLGFSRNQLTDRLHLLPNEGIRRPAQYWLIAVLLSAPSFGLLLGPLFGGAFVLRFGLVGRPALEPLFGLVLGSVTGLVTMLVLGLVGWLSVIVQHHTLRFWLWRTHLFPWNTAPFLEDATARILLRRVGDGYSFTHRLLLDYFADLNPAMSSASPTKESSSIRPENAGKDDAK